jgi:hypothetical protein
MGKRILFIMILPMLVFALAGVSYGWQGRMGGMGDPYGLVADEADFLIHTAKIAKGEGVKLYGDYRFLYTGVLEWDYEMDIFTPAGVLYAVFNREGEGEEQRHEVLLGSSFPLGPGRMGLFFTYQGMRGDATGEQPEWYPPAVPIYYDEYELISDLDNFAFRLLYGLPVGGFNLGGEVQFAYRQEENKALYDEDYGSGVRDLYTNYFWGGLYDYENLFPFMLPYDSQYWEALFKGSLEGKVGPLDLEFTLRAGFLFGGDNQYECKDVYPIPPGNLYAAFDAKGDVTGWRIGGDVWLRYPLAGDLSLPFLVRVDYQAKTRDGDGPGQVNLDAYNYSYESQEQSLGITAGGGLEKELANGAKIAGGIYYSYLQGNNDLQITEYETATGLWWNYDYSGFPDSSEHQVMLRLAGELALSPVVTLRMGLVPFFGWVRQDFKYSYLTSAPSGYTDDVPTDGYHWGIGASLGGTIKIPPVTLEPFVNGGYQQLNLEGDGNRVNSSGAITDLYEMSKDRNEWSIGGGLSVLFDLP